MALTRQCFKKQKQTQSIKITCFHDIFVKWPDNFTGAGNARAPTGRSRRHEHERGNVLSICQLWARAIARARPWAHARGKMSAGRLKEHGKERIIHMNNLFLFYWTSLQKLYFVHFCTDNLYYTLTIHLFYTVHSKTNGNNMYSTACINTVRAI